MNRISKQQKILYIMLFILMVCLYYEHFGDIIISYLEKQYTVEDKIQYMFAYFNQKGSDIIKQLLLKGLSVTILGKIDIDRPFQTFMLTHLKDILERNTVPINYLKLLFGDTISLWYNHIKQVRTLTETVVQSFPEDQRENLSENLEKYALEVFIFKS